MADRNNRMNDVDEETSDPRVRYQLVQKIGQGSYGSVYKAYDIVRAACVAVKMIDLEGIGDELDVVNQEIAIMSNVQCPQLMKYHASHIVGMNLWIIMEYLEAGSISDLLKDSGPLDEPSIAYVLKELLLALRYLHDEGKIHRDVKAGNLLLSADAGVKLGDFGVTGQLTDSMDKRKTRVGTPFWMSPEVISEAAYDGCADIWSTGITGIELATGLPPYAREIHPIQVIFLIPKNPPPTLEGNFSLELKDFISQCLQKDPLARPSATALLKHPFLKVARKSQSFMDCVSKKAEDNLTTPNDPELVEMRNLTRVNSSDSGWDFTIRTNKSNSNYLMKRSVSQSSMISEGGGMNHAINNNKKLTKNNLNNSCNEKGSLSYSTKNLSLKSPNSIISNAVGNLQDKFKNKLTRYASLISIPSVGSSGRVGSSRSNSIEQVVRPLLMRQKSDTVNYSAHLADRLASSTNTNSIMKDSPIKRKNRRKRLSNRLSFEDEEVSTDAEYFVKREKEQSGNLSPKSQDKRNDENLKNTIALFTSKMVNKNLKPSKDETSNTLQTNSYESDLSNVSEGTSTYDESSFLRNGTPNSLANESGSPRPEDVENYMVAGMVPFKTVLTVLLRHAATSELSELFQNVIRPALQRLSDFTNSATPSTTNSASASASASAVDSRNKSNDIGIDPRGDPRNNSNEILHNLNMDQESLNDKKSFRKESFKHTNKIKGGFVKCINGDNQNMINFNSKKSMHEFGLDCNSNGNSSKEHAFNPSMQSTLDALENSSSECDDDGPSVNGSNTLLRRVSYNFMPNHIGLDPGSPSLPRGYSPPPHSPQKIRRNSIDQSIIDEFFTKDVNVFTPKKNGSFSHSRGPSMEELKEERLKISDCVQVVDATAKKDWTDEDARTPSQESSKCSINMSDLGDSQSKDNFDDKHSKNDAILNNERGRNNSIEDQMGYNKNIAKIKYEKNENEKFEESDSQRIQNEKMRTESLELHRLETQDLVTVLIASLTALDQHTKGEMINEFATTMMGFIMEELDGNAF
eukprot:CAMPEP_0119040106 /NCGR_PEP_ID=MMETSP1177-20130426/9951_1 /TAXON_ID=2985 /ORGANISM="Ochromonas sp, Strain CCMP1899" /LENGTH=1029 /DNA_ID=CAMNT_0007004845 /DNA_START=28 /DNA_END=3117 /DNA_ORIENTATION=+